MQEEFMKQLNRAHLFNGAFSFARKYDYPANQYSKARVLYTPLAFTKMQALLQGFATEIAWHGLVLRGEDPGDYIVYDIVTHKQTVSGAKVDTDDEEYREFLMSLSDEDAANLCLQAHSHVNMSTTPSDTDLAHQERIIADKARKKRGFQIFQIWNKNMKVNSYVYDFDENVYYEEGDVEVDVLLDAKSDYLVCDFIQDAKALVKTKTYQHNQTQQYKQPSTPAAPATTAKEEKPKQTQKPREGYHPESDPNYLPRKFTPKEIEELKETYCRYFRYPADHDFDNDEDWEDFLYYASWGIPPTAAIKEYIWT